jgi:hypothetical protein
VEVIGLHTTSQPGSACGLVWASCRVPARRYKTAITSALQPVLSVCSPVQCASSEAADRRCKYLAQHGEASQSRQVNAGVVVIFTQPKSGHMFARCKNIISACPVFLQYCACHEFVKVYYRTYSQSYLAAIRGVRGTKRGVDAR